MEQIFHERVFGVPNLLTLLRIALLPVIAWTYQMGSMLAALCVYLLAMLTDALDGFIARRTHQITALGQLLDPLADKLTLMTLLLLLYADGELPLWALVTLLAKEAVLMVGSAFALSRGVVVHALPVGKAATVTFVVFIASHLAGFAGFADAAMLLFIGLSAAALAGYGLNLAALMNERTRASEGGALAP